MLYLTDVFDLPTKGLISLVYILVDTGLNIIGKNIEKGTLSITSSRITLANNEIKAIIKVTKSLENRRVLLKGTTRKSTGEEGRFLHFFRTLMKPGLTLIKIVLIPLAKTILTPSGLTAAASATDAAVHKRMFGSGYPLDLSSRMTTMTISNKEMNDIMKTVKSSEQSGLLIKGVKRDNQKQSKRIKRRISCNVIRHFRCYFIRESINK